MGEEQRCQEIRVFESGMGSLLTWFIKPIPNTDMQL